MFEAAQEVCWKIVPGTSAFYDGTKKTISYTAFSGEPNLRCSKKSLMQVALSRVKMLFRMFPSFGRQPITTKIVSRKLRDNLIAV